MQFFRLSSNPNLSDGGASICNIYVLKPFHKWNIIGSKNYMGIAWTWFFAFQFQWDRNFIMRVLQNLGPFSFKLHHNMISPLYFSFLMLWWKIFKRRKNEIKLCNICILGIECWLDFFMFHIIPKCWAYNMHI